MHQQSENGPLMQLHPVDPVNLVQTVDFRCARRVVVVQFLLLLDAGLYSPEVTRYVAVVQCALVVGGLILAADEQGTRCESGTAPPL